MGHYRKLYESADAARRAMIVEAAHRKAEADKSVAFAKRERERGDNLQRELLEREGEIARWKAEGPAYNAALREEVVRLKAQVKAPTVAPSHRWKMPDERNSKTVKLRIGDKKLIKKCPTCEQPTPDSPRCSSFTLHIGYKPDGTIGEWFIRPDREKKTDLVASLADGWATSSSYAIQNGGSVEWLTDKARYAKDESAGVPLVWDENSGDPEKYIPHPAFHHVSSVLDYAAKIIDRVKAGHPAVRLTEAEAAEAKKLAAAAEATP